MIAKNFANRAYSTLTADNPSYRFDPTIILLILEILQEVLPKIVEICDREPETLPIGATEISGFGWRWLRRQVRRSIGWVDYRNAGGMAIVRALVKTVAEATPDEVCRIYEEISQTR